MEDSCLRLIRVMELERFSWLRHGFSTRQGGISVVYRGLLRRTEGGQRTGEEGELNLGWTQEDSHEAVTENRRRLIDCVADGAEMKLVTIRQVHGATTRAVQGNDGAEEGRLETSEGRAVLEGDGLTTDVSGVLLGIQTADCVPVLVADTKRRAVAAFHAGWRGTAARGVEQGIAEMEREYGSQPEDLVAAVGPSIGVCCYVVGEEVREKFEQEFSYAGEVLRIESGKLRLDLWEANRQQLLAAGIRAEKIAVVGECSGCTVDATERRRYFSHRIEQGITGRMMSVIGVV